VPFIEKDVAVDRAAGEEMIRKSGQTGVPVITFGDEVIVGFDRPRLEQLLAKAATGQRPRLGLQVADAATAARPGVAGAYVGRVAPGSPGEKAGLKQGDVINELNSRPVHSAHDLEDALSALPVGSRAVIRVLRGQQTLMVEMVLQA